MLHSRSYTRSCDLTLLDYYLWVVVKDKCYAEKVDALKDNIREAIVKIQLNTFDNVLKNRTDQTAVLTLLDYYLWGVVKDKCYAEKVDALKDNTREAIVKIYLHTFDNVLKNRTDQTAV